MDDNEFFREATLRLCGNLEIEVALDAFLNLLGSTLPAHAANLAVWESDIQSIRVIARASEDGGKRTDILVPMPADAAASIDELEREFKKTNWRDTDIINDSTAAPGFREVTERFYSEPCSLLHLVLETVDRPLCSILVFAPGKDLYTAEHGRILDLIKKPLSIAMSNALKHRETVVLQELLADDNRYLHRELHRMVGDEIIGADFGLKDVMGKVQLVAPTESPVMISGETGVGKDVIANAIHLGSPRREGPFIAVNCGAIPSTLIDSELFGHEKGSFTGALSQKRGRFERANKGTILLDEIGEMPPEAQVRLLRVLQNREIERIGGSETIALDIRVIAATNRDLETEVREGRFRQDLFFRLNVFPIEVPPLRDRTGDIPAFVHHFLHRKAKQLKVGEVPRLADGAIHSLTAYHWPGNVRELENVIERAMILYRGEPLRFDDLGQSSSRASAGDPSQTGEELLELDAMTKKHIEAALRKTGGKIHGPGGAGEVLGVNPNTLRYKMQKLGIPLGKNKEG